MTVRRAAGIGAGAVLLALLLLAVRRLDLALAFSVIGEVRTTWLVLAMLAFAAIIPLWALQWFLLSSPTPARTYPRMLGVVALTSSILNTAPMLAGEAAGVVLLVTRIGLERGAAVSVLAMDQLIVGLAKLCVLGGAASVLPLPPGMRAGVQSLLVGVFALLLLLVAVAIRPALLSPLARRLPPRLAQSVQEMGAGLSPLRDMSLGGSAFALALMKKLAELAGIVAIQRAFGVVLPLSSALLVLGALNLATLLPLLPANVGAFEGAIVVAYGALGLAPERALAMAVVHHACYFVALALPGYRWIGDVLPARRAATS